MSEVKHWDNTPIPSADAIRTIFSQSVLGTLFIFGLLAAVLLAVGRWEYPYLHTVLDTGTCLLSGVLALLLWDMGVRIDRMFPRWVALSFAITFLLELIHALVSIEWFGFLTPITHVATRLRSSTWPPTAHLLPIGIGGSLWLLSRGGRRVWEFALGLTFVGVGLLSVFYRLPRYASTTWLGITRPMLVLVPVLWALVGAACWRQRRTDRILPALAVITPIFLFANVSMLYSRAPHDTQAMIAHLGRIGGALILLLSLMQMASSDMLERIRIDRQLADLNQGLERRVEQRTAELAVANTALKEEITVRHEAEQRVQAQLQRLDLLNQITRAIGERQGLKSIFQVVIRSLEDQLPVDFGCICLYDQPAEVLIVTSVGLRSEILATELALTDQARIRIDENALSQCVRGLLVYEPDIGPATSPFPSLLSRGGLRSLVVAPLIAESQVFGVLIVARRESHSFSSGECEFLRHVSEHAALAAHQAQLHGALQMAYDDLKQTQHVVMQQERLRALGQMASGIAHDINNAISPAMLYTESLLDEEVGLSDRARRDLEIVQRAIEDVAQTVARMGEFYRAREDQLPLVPVQLNHLVEQVVALTRARWSDMPQERGMVIQVQTELMPDLPMIVGIESEIREALTNLVLNAADAMPEGGQLTLRSSIGRRTNDNENAPLLQHVDLEVMDTGVGMDDDMQRRCLEPFFTTKGDRGTGLGLAMVYGVMQRHGAEIEIESTPGQGTIVRLSFPAAVSDATSAGLAPPPRLPGRLRVLVVDDDPLVLKSLHDILGGEGHTIIGADGGRAGIDAFRAAFSHNETFDLVITDLGMPYVDGRQVAGAVKETSPSTPVILLTGWGRRLMADGDVPAHVDRVIAKPPRLRELREALAACCAPKDQD